MQWFEPDTEFDAHAEEWVNDRYIKEQDRPRWAGVEQKRLRREKEDGKMNL